MDAERVVITADPLLPLSDNTIGQSTIVLITVIRLVKVDYYRYQIIIVTIGQSRSAVDVIRLIRADHSPSLTKLIGLRAHRTFAQGVIIWFRGVS